MRRLAAALVVATLASSRVHAAEFAWPGRGAVRMTVPSGWTVDRTGGGDATSLQDGISFRATPATKRMHALVTLLAAPRGTPTRAEDVRKELERLVEPHLDGSVEKAFAPRALSMTQGTGWFVQLTDASLVGKPRDPENSKAMRNALAALDGHTLMIATIFFDDPAWPEVGEAMSLVSSVRLDAKGGRPVAASTNGPFEFTVPQSRVKVRVTDSGLRLDEPVDLERRYFKLSRDDPQLIVSGWLEPASAYRGLKDFWDSERRSPAYAGAGAPSRIELLRVGDWEVVAFDVVLGGGTSAHLRAERVQAGTWIDLHLSTTSARAATALRDDLVTALRAIEVVEK